MQRYNRKINLSAFIIALVIASLVVTTALAGKFHFNSVSFDLGGSLVVNGDLAGIGNETAIVTLSATGSVTALCQNNGGKQAPGRNSIVVTVQQTDTFITDNYGRTLVRVVVPDPTSLEFEPSPTPKDAGCPNTNWAVVGIVDKSTDWTAAQIIVSDLNGVVQLRLTYTCVTTFENGIGTSVQCTEV